jgi:UDP-N-acetylmuramyl pentapeptide synthase
VTGVQTCALPISEEAADWLAANATRGDVVLVKGSRGVGLDRVVRRALGGAAEGAH